MKTLRLVLFPLFAMALGGTTAMACSAMGEAGDATAMEGGDESGAGSGGGLPEGDGSIDVTNDGDPAPAPPSNYAHLCTSRMARADETDCVPNAAMDPCVDQAPADDGGSTAPDLSSCVLVSDGEGAAVGECVAQGKGVYADPCQSALDCTAGLGCAPAGNVEGDYGGACRDYCCGDVEACPKATYCAPQPMSETPDLQIPVCIPASNCTLLEENACEGELACTIVREDGTTSCVEPGAGLEGDGCPCADGYMCAKITGECKKLCHSDKPEDCPAGQTCQGGSMQFPDGIGVCTESYK